MQFIKYQHIERFGTTEVQHIELGKCYVFPKIDGTNASVWLGEDGAVQAGSRRRHLTLEKDNAGFLEWVQQQSNIEAYLKAHPTHRLFGEWLVPHSLKTYRQDAWRRFYVFDVCVDKEESEILHESDSKLHYLPYDEYLEGLKLHSIDYISPIAIIENSNYEQLVEQLKKNIFLIEDGKGVGEGVVIKNYDFRNKYNRPSFAKIVTSEFREKHNKEMGAPEMKGKKLVEQDIVTQFVTKALCEKVYAKISLESKGWSSKYIPRLLHTVYYDLVREEMWEIVKKCKNPTIDFKRLQHLTYQEVKTKLPIVFGE